MSRRNINVNKIYIKLELIEYEIRILVNLE